VQTQIITKKQFDEIIAKLRKKFYSFVVIDNGNIKECGIEDLKREFFRIFIDSLGVKKAHLFVSQFTFRSRNKYEHEIWLDNIMRAIIPSLYFYGSLKVETEYFVEVKDKLPQFFEICLNVEVPIILDKLQKIFQTRYCVARYKDKIILFIGKMPYIDYKIECEEFWAGTANIDISNKKIKIDFFNDDGLEDHVSLKVFNKCIQQEV